MREADLRRSFYDFWAERGHEVRPSASLIPHEPSLLFTVAGMVPFMPYFLGEETPPSKRMTTIQKCVRAGGKHNDLDDVGRTNRHFTFFEMMGNFSFGDYFKSEACAWAWEFLVDVLGLPVDALWVTVHETDDDAVAIWRDEVGVAPERIQKMGADNWWAAGDRGPCGPCSEIYYDTGPEFGPPGGPGAGSTDRFVEIWNLVFMQFANDGTGTLTPLAAPGIDTGAGLERLLAVLQGVPSVWETDLFAPLLAQAQAVAGRAYGDDPDADVSMRIFADHARATAMLIHDGVFPSNEDRGYVLRRIIRRAVRHAWVLGVTEAVMARLVETVVDVMSGAYPELAESRQFIVDVVSREEERFRATLATGSAILDTAVDELADGSEFSGEVAFRLHDTFGFPVELTLEILTERGISLDRDGFDAAMDSQRERARAAKRVDGPTFAAERYSELAEQFGPTEFVRDADVVADARVLAVFPVAAGPDAAAAADSAGPAAADPADSAAAADSAGPPAAAASRLVELFLDRTPFYAESGGQVADVGTLTAVPAGDPAAACPVVLDVVDCTFAVAGVHRHLCRVPDGLADDDLPAAGSVVRAEIDAPRRAAIRRNHTGTHVLHWALRRVLGEHVKQAGSLVAPDRLRFDYSHHEAPDAALLREVEDVANAEILANGRCRHYETTMTHAREIGAIAFFGDKYGDFVRVLEAGDNSVELCGGTHVAALGDIGHLRIVSESSIGSNLRRIEAITGTRTVERLQEVEATLEEVAQLLNAPGTGVAAALARRLDETKVLRKQIRALERKAAGGAVADLVAAADSGVVVADMGELARDALRDVAVAVRDADGVRAVVLASAPPEGGVALVAAVDPDGPLTAADLLADAAASVQGGFARKGNAPVVVAGGRNPDGIAAALDQARSAAGLATAE